MRLVTPRVSETRTLFQHDIDQSVFFYPKYTQNLGPVPQGMLALRLSVLKYGSLGSRSRTGNATLASIRDPGFNLPILAIEDPASIEDPTSFEAGV